MMELFNCRLCGGELVQEEDDTYRCKCCGKVFVKSLEDVYVTALKSVLDEEKMERVASARRNLWREMHEEYIGSESCLNYARELKGFLPEDYYANFAEKANSKSYADIARFLNDSAKKDIDDFADAVLDFMLKSLTGKTLAAVSSYIERAYPDKKNPKYREYIDRYEKEAKKVDKGVYECSVQRDVFLAYSGKDTKEVTELCDYLEGNGLRCFFSLRNLSHGRDARDDYRKRIYEAIDHCSVVVFVSSKNSRDFSCDAVTIELPYMRDRDRACLQGPERNKPYDKIPEDRKTPRVEYILDAYKDGERTVSPVREYFEGLQWCLTKEDVLERVREYVTAVPKEYIKKSSRVSGEDVGQSSPVRPAAAEPTVTLDSKEKNILEHTERLIGIGSFQDALNGLDELEKELIAVRGKASAALYYYKILAKYKAKDFDEAVANLTHVRKSLFDDKDYLLSQSCDDEAYKAKLKNLAQKSEDIITQQNTAEENERRRQEIARAEAEEEKRKHDEAEEAKNNRVYRAVVASFTLVLVILFALMVTGLVIGYSGNVYFCNAFCGIVGAVSFAAFLVVLILNRIVLGDYRESYFLGAYDSAPLGLRRFWMYGLLVVFALSYILGVFFMF